MPKRTYLILGSILIVTTAAIAFDFALRGLHRVPQMPLQYVTGGDADRGRSHIERYGCGACHVIPGIRDATGRVGPNLTAIREQIYVAGVLTNTGDNLAAWIEAPRDIDPQTAMPNLDVSRNEARDMAAYLYSMD